MSYSGNRHGLMKSLAFIAALMTLIACTNSSGRTEPFLGTELKNRDPAADFALEDEDGRAVSLSDYRGKVVVLTFLYTNCPDVCPAITNQLKDTFAIIDGLEEDVSLVAISVDPESDTVESAREFSELWEFADNWDFLVGDREELALIWKSYFTDPVVNLSNLGDNVHVHVDGSAHTHSPEDGTSADPSDPNNRYLVIHQAPVFLIDGEGRMRVVHTSPLEPDAIAHDIKLLVN